LADAVGVKRGDQLSETVSQPSIQRIKSFDEWAVDRDPVLTSTTWVKPGKTSICYPWIVGNVYHPTCGVRGRTGAPFPYCWSETEARSPKWSPAAARSVPERPKRWLQVCTSRTRDGDRISRLVTHLCSRLHDDRAPDKSRPLGLIHRDAAHPRHS